MEKQLREFKEGQKAVISELKGESRFINRIVSIGLTPGCKLEIVQNKKNRPLLVYSRDTMIALNKNECSNVYAQEV